MLASAKVKDYVIRQDPHLTVYMPIALLIMVSRLNVIIQADVSQQLIYEPFKGTNSNEF